MEEFTSYQDPLNGFSLEKPADWTVLTTPKGVGVVCTKLPLASCWFRLAKTEDPKEFLRFLLAEDEKAALQLGATGLVRVGKPGLWWKEADKGILVRVVYPMSGPLLQAMGLGLQEALVGTTYITGSGKLIYALGYSAPSSTIEALRPNLERTLRSFKFKEPMEASIVDFYDPARGMVAYRVKVPKGWGARGAVDAMGRPQFYVEGDGAKIIKKPSDAFLDVRGLGMPLIPPPGFRLSPFMRADQYALAVLSETGLRTAGSAPEGLYPLLLGEVWGAIVSSLMAGTRVAFDSRLLEVESGAGLSGYAWAITLGTWMMGMGGWTGELALALSQDRDGAELALGVLRGILGSLTVNPAWYKRVSHETIARAREQAKMRRAIMSEFRREIQHMREMRQMTEATFSEIREMHMESFYADLRESVRDVHGWSNAIGGYIDVRDPETGEIFNIEDVASDYWINESGDIIIGVEGPLIEDELRAEGWRKMEKSLDGFPEQFDFI